MIFSKLKRAILALLVLFSFLILIIFFFRIRLATWALGKVKEKFKTEYQAVLSFNNIAVHGLSGISGTNFFIVQQGKDTLIKSKALAFEINLADVLTGDLSLKSFSISDGYFHPVKNKNGDNFSFLLKGNRNSESADTPKGYGFNLNRLMTKTFKVLPPRLKISGFTCALTKDERKFVLGIKKMFLFDKSYRSTLIMPNTNQTLILEGEIHKRKKLIRGHLYAEKASFKLPYLKDRYQLDFNFDTLKFSLDENDFNNENLLLKGKFRFDELSIRHPKLDSNQLALKKIDVNYLCSIGKTSLAFETDSTLINDICLKGKAFVDRRDKGVYSLRLNMPELDAQKFFSSLPSGLFSSFDGLKVTGKLSYQLDFYLDRSQIDSLKFSSNFIENGFKVVHFGKTDFSKMNSSFSQTAYEKGIAVKTFLVGPENPEFVPIEQISPYLKNAVLCSEDGSFFWHKGFREDAFIMAMKDNLKKGMFARGGSTISMQLVKNIFLSREKTIARKVEEALIVWLIEKNRLTSKERMYEVYLNVIEWGPGVYGIGNASEFYFGKHPSNLSIEESIFLASIVPQPKAFKYYFDEDGKLKPFLSYYYKKLGTLLLRREIISEEENNKITPYVRLTGRASEYVFQDTLSVDSSFFQPEEILP